MRTARLLPVSRSMHCSGGCTCPGGCTYPGGVPAQGYLPGGVPAKGVYLPRYSPPHEQNSWHTLLKNITLPQTSFARGKNELTETKKGQKLHSSSTELKFIWNFFIVVNNKFRRNYRKK